MEKPNTKLEEVHAGYIGSVMEGGERDEQGDQTNKQLGDKMEDIKKEIFAMKMDPQLFKNHQLPLARIKKIMKSDEDVRMISSETPVLFAKACQIFIIQLTHRAWAYTEEAKRRTLQKSDIASCIENTEIFDFLIDIIPKEDLKSKKQEAPPNIANYQLNYGKGIELYQKAQPPSNPPKK